MQDEKRAAPKDADREAVKRDLALLTAATKATRGTHSGVRSRSVTFRLQQGLYDRLSQLAQQEHRSMNMQLHILLDSALCRVASNRRNR